MRFSQNNNNPTLQVLGLGAYDDVASAKAKKMIPRISLLALLFGTGSWIAITGLWLEMPLLIQKLPEGWRLASHLNIMIQIANIGPLLYWLAHRSRLLNEVCATHIQLWVGMASCALLIIGWDQTVMLFGAQRSVMLLGATFGLALVDCTSSITFLPFMARFDSSYMTPYLVGEGLSGFIPSMVVLLQGVGEDRKECGASDSDEIVLTNHTTSNNLTSLMVLDTKVLQKSASKLIEPRFSVEIFFFSLFFTILLSYLAFLALQFLPICRKESEKHIQLEMQSRSSYNLNRPSVSYEQGGNDEENRIRILGTGANQAGDRKRGSSVEFETIALKQDQDQMDQMDSQPTRQLIQEPARNDLPTEHQSKSNNQKSKSDKKRIYYYLLMIMCWNCFTTFGFFPSIQPYSALPYGVEVLHYVVVLTGLAYPAGCFFGMLVENKSLRLITILTAIGSLTGIYIVACALMSPSPPLADSSIGGLVMILCWICFVATLSYAKTMITLWICDYNSSKGMFWVGMNTQLGAAAGALLNFILINYSGLFNECG